YLIRAVRRECRSAATSHGSKPQVFVQDRQHAAKVGAALENEPGSGDHAVGALPARQPRILLDAVEGNFAGAAEDREHRLLPPEVDGVVAPLAVGDLAPIEIEDGVELGARESNCRGG